MQRIHIFVTGKVQGVFFRQTTKSVATKNNVVGWVKNLKDGRVEAVLEGQDIDINKVVEWAHTGPTDAVVDNVEIHHEDYTNQYSQFDIVVD